MFDSLNFDLTNRGNVHHNLEKKAVFLSAGTILQRCFSDILDIDPREIEFANPTTTTVAINGTNHKTFQLTFFDGHDNGSGYVRKIKEMLISSGDTSLIDFISNSKFFQYMKGTDHDLFCSSSSCYKCIRTYDNSALHGLLDWRMGLDLIEYMSDPNFMLDFVKIESYVNRISKNMYDSKIVTDAEGNSAIALSEKTNGNHKYLITHPIGKYDVGAYLAGNPGVESKSIYGLMLIS